MKKSNAWSMGCLSHRASEPVYYIEDCWISRPVWAAQYAQHTGFLPRTDQPERNQMYQG